LVIQISLLLQPPVASGDPAPSPLQYCRGGGGAAQALKIMQAC